MTQEETLKWFEDIGIPAIREFHGPYSSDYFVYEDNDGRGEYNPYHFIIEVSSYTCNGDCDHCEDKTYHGNCDSEDLWINEDGTISYGGETYKEEDFDKLLDTFY